MIGKHSLSVRLLDESSFCSMSPQMIGKHFLSVRLLDESSYCSMSPQMIGKHSLSIRLLDESSYCSMSPQMIGKHSLSVRLLDKSFTSHDSVENILSFSSIALACERRGISGCRLSAPAETSDSQKYVCVRRLRFPGIQLICRSTSLVLGTST